MKRRILLTLVSATTLSVLLTVAGGVAAQTAEPTGKEGRI